MERSRQRSSTSFTGQGSACSVVCATIRFMISGPEAPDPSAKDNSDGVTPNALPAIRRELFMDALMVARHDHDPGTQWEQFCETAWKEAALAFGFVEREPWPGSSPSPGVGAVEPQRDSDDVS